MSIIDPMLTDIHRPRYHYLPAANWMNDPNGLIQWKGKYHLFYQYNPKGPFHGDINWGHAVSEDLAHWIELPIALIPTPDSPDADGCWSGCAIDFNGTPTFMYTGVAHNLQRPCLAFGDDDLLVWRKYEGNPVISEPPPGVETIAFRDHSLWREDGQWYQVIGSGIEGKGGAAFVYRSSDLFTWEYVGPLVDDDCRGKFDLINCQIWECPSFFALGEQHVLLVSVWDKNILYYVAACVGDYNGQQFVPRAVTKLDAGQNCFYAPQTMQDDHGRRLIWGWLQEERHRDLQLAAGWSGVMSLPRLLWLDEKGELRMSVPPELALLRKEHSRTTHVTVLNEHLVPLTAEGDDGEVIIEFEPRNSGRSEVYARRSPKGEEVTLIAIDWDRRKLIVDRTHASLSPDVAHEAREADLSTEIEQRCRLQLFFDHSALEVNVNDQAWISCRIYPTRSDSVGLSLGSQGGATHVKSVDLYHLAV